MPLVNGLAGTSGSTVWLMTWLRMTSKGCEQLWQQREGQWPLEVRFSLELRLETAGERSASAMERIPGQRMTGFRSPTHIGPGREVNASLSRYNRGCRPYLKATPMTDVTRILSAIEQGDAQAVEQLLPLVYDELRELAAHKMAQENPGQTLQATALVHEAYMRLVDAESARQWDSRGHFFAAAAEAMRRILVDNAVRKKRPKHGGDRQRVDLEAVATVGDSPRGDILALDEALARLSDVDKTSAEVVKLKYFAGLTIPEIAPLLGISPRTADRRWAYARAWLHRELCSE